MRLSTILVRVMFLHRWFVDDKSYRRVERIDDLLEWSDVPLRVHGSIWDASWWATGPPGHQIFVDYTYEVRYTRAVRGC